MLRFIYFNVSAYILLAAAAPSGCSHAPEATAAERTYATAAVVTMDTTQMVATDEPPGDPAIDRLLDAYARYVDANLRLTQQLADGDMVAAVELEALAEDARELTSTLASPAMASRLSTAQATRLQALDARYEEASARLARQETAVERDAAPGPDEQVAEQIEQQARSFDQEMQAMEKSQQSRLETAPQNQPTLY